MQSPDAPADGADDGGSDDVSLDISNGEIESARQSRRRTRKREPDAREREVIRRLASMRDERPSAPNDLVDEILAYVYSQPESERRVDIRWFVLATAVAVVATAGCVAAIVVARRHRVIAAAARAVVPGPGASAATRSILHLRPVFRSAAGTVARRHR